MKNANTYYGENRERLQTASRGNYRANRVARLAQKKQYLAANRQQISARRKQQYAARRDRIRDSRYNLAPGEYELILAAQGHVCAICGRNFEQTNRLSPVVDHCHATGKVRGILHRTCNLGLGNFEDNPVFIANAARYLTPTK